MKTPPTPPKDLLASLSTVSRVGNSWIDKLINIPAGAGKFRYAVPEPHSVPSLPSSGMHIYVTPYLPLPPKSVPYPRSPARAKRRAAQGHKQHYRIIPGADAFVIHKTTMQLNLPAPAILVTPQLMSQLREKMRAEFDAELRVMYKIDAARKAGV